MIISFTGHRPDKLGGYKTPNPIFLSIMDDIEKTLIEKGPSKVISGMALGVDQWAASIALKLGIPFIAAVPFEGQESIWPDETKKSYKTLLKCACDIVIVSPGSYAAWKMQKRNQWMIDNSDEVIAIWNGSPDGGTANAVNYCKKVNKPLTIINDWLKYI